MNAQTRRYATSGAFELGGRIVRSTIMPPSSGSTRALANVAASAIRTVKPIVMSPLIAAVDGTFPQVFRMNR